MNPTIWLVIGMFAMIFVLYFTRERFQPEFLDKRQVARTVETEFSHYDQTTNHMIPSPASMGPLSGMQTPFQVNQYKAYVQ
jgi:hypothetical protein